MPSAPAVAIVSPSGEKLMSVTALGSRSVKREALLAVSYTPAVAPVAIANGCHPG